MAEDYNIIEAIKKIEDELIASMIRNLDHHRAEENDRGINWEQWQVQQLAALEEYKKRNLEKYSSTFDKINSRIDALIRMQRAAGNADQEIAILQAIKDGAKLQRAVGGINVQFFRMNDRKMDALIRATKNDMQTAEYAMLRMSNDKYRKVIFDSQVYAASGAATYEKAVDMATKDFLRAGINCVEYKNGARHTVSDYADMAIRTASKRAYLTGEGEKRKEWGIATVIMNKRGNPCPKCLPFVGKVLIDDVWSGGSKKDGEYPLMSSAIAAGLYHPRCKDGHTTYFPGISTPPDNQFTKKELQDVEEQSRQEARQQYAQRQAENCDRLAKYLLDEDNQKMYISRAKDWKEQIGKSHGFGYREVTQEWLEKATPNSHEVADLTEFVSEGQVFKVDGKHVILSYSAAEKQIAELLRKELGGEICMVPRVLYPEGISTPDYMFKGERYDLKCLSGASKNLIYNAISKKKAQADNFILDFSACTLSDTELIKQTEDIFRSSHTQFVNSIIAVRDSKILKIFVRDKK